MNGFRFNLFFFIFTLLTVACSSVPERNYTPGLAFYDKLSDTSNGPEMIVVPKGSFIMGAGPDNFERLPFELPPHRVEIDSPFAVSKYEITFADYDKYVAANAVNKPSDKGWGKEYWGRGNMPVFNVSWFDAQAYVEWLSRETGYDYRLITEAEWEYVARAGTITTYYTGNCIDTDLANYHGGYKLEGCRFTNLYRGKTTATGSFSPNPWGLHDVYGNIFEWTQDCWHENYNGAPDDGSAWYGEDGGDCDVRVLRGGSWSGRPIDIRSANRSYNKPGFKSIFIGFRVVREL